MFTTVRYFIKTSITFLLTGILTGLYMIISRNVFQTGYTYNMISAHTHILLVGFMLMMIMGVALWFFPRAEKEDKKYNPTLIWITYWMITFGTAFRFLFELLSSFVPLDFLSIFIAFSATMQVAAIILYFYSMWGRIRSVGSHIREAKGEKF